MNIKQKHELFNLMSGLLYGEAKIKFKMNRFATIGNSLHRTINPKGLNDDCGTHACALGHAPLYCSPPMHHDWRAYCMQLFGEDMKIDNILFTFIFGAYWETDRNQAAARMYLYLTKGIDGIEPYCKKRSSYHEFDWNLKFYVPTRNEVMDLRFKLGLPFLDEVKFSGYPASEAEKVPYDWQYPSWPNSEGNWKERVSPEMQDAWLHLPFPSRIAAALHYSAIDFFEKEKPETKKKEPVKCEEYWATYKGAELQSASLYRHKPVPLGRGRSILSLIKRLPYNTVKDELCKALNIPAKDIEKVMHTLETLKLVEEDEK